MKIERTRIHFSATFSRPSPSSNLKVPIIYTTDDPADINSLGPNYYNTLHRTRGDENSPFSSFSRPQLFKWWMTLSNGYISIQCTTQLFSLIFIPWIVIYPVDSATTGAQFSCYLEACVKIAQYRLSWKANAFNACTNNKMYLTNNT